MAKPKKRLSARKAKLKRGKVRSKLRKKTVKRAAPKKAKKKRGLSKRNASTAKRARERRQRQLPGPTVEDTIVDVIDEPVPGVLRVTEIEEVSVTTPDSEEDDEDE
jgi:hypothetical protein